MQPRASFGLSGAQCPAQPAVILHHTLQPGIHSPLLLGKIRSPFLPCSFMDQHLQTHPAALTEELAGSSDTVSSATLPTPQRWGIALDSSRPSQWCRHPADRGTDRVLAIGKSNVRNPMWSLFQSARSEQKGRTKREIRNTMARRIIRLISL